MGTAAKPTRENRTITVDFRSEATYFQLLGDGKAFLACILAFVMSLGFQLTHKATCRGGGCLTRHSHDTRVRLNGVTLWRIQCTTCKAVPSSPSCRTLSCALARCDPRWPATPCWRPTVASVGSGAPWSPRSPPWPSTGWSVHLGARV